MMNSSVLFYIQYIIYMFIPGGKGSISETTPCLSNATFLSKRPWAAGFGGSAEQPFLGFLAPAKSREGADGLLDLRLEEKIFGWCKVGSTIFFQEVFFNHFLQVGVLYHHPKGNHHFFKMMVDFQEFEFEDTWGENAHTHTKFATKTLKKHFLIREDHDPFDEDISLKTCGFNYTMTIFFVICWDHFIVTFWQAQLKLFLHVFRCLKWFTKIIYIDSVFDRKY